MRPAVICMLLLIAPMASGISLPSPVADFGINGPGKEVELVLTEGVWTQDLWFEVQDLGLDPLRIINQDTLLVWKNKEIIQSDWFEVRSVDNGEWRGEVDFSNFESSEVKILLEPRMSNIAQLQTINHIRNLGIIVDFEDSDYLEPFSKSVKVELPIGFEISNILSLDGILWVEPVLKTESRNLVSAGLMGSGTLISPPQWSFGLNGTGVVLGVADSGLDADHACFRNATSIGNVGTEDEGVDAVVPPGVSHRKVLLYNTSLDDGDNPEDMDYRHGTHIAGTLVCHDVYSYREGIQPTNGSTMSYAAKLLFQDVVNESGWIEPDDITELLLENTLSGGVIHSDSWGDDTTAYTARSADFDLWALEVPWSLSFIAPGNTGGQLLEPSNARNVVAIGSSTKEIVSQVSQSSSVGPTDAETYGIFAMAPGVSISSAKADGLEASLNNDLYSSSGTSMSTPMAASFAGVIQQMVEQGWVMGDNEVLTEVNLSTITPEWSQLPNSTLFLGPGFTPSGSLLRSLMGLATSDISQENGGFVRNSESGWGVLNLSEILDFEAFQNRLSEDNLTPTENIWIHDSFRSDINISDWLKNRLANSPNNDILQAPWNGGEAFGPFLQSGEVWTKRLVPNGIEDLEVILSFPAKPEPSIVDDLQLVVELSNGKIVVGDDYDIDGFSTVYSGSLDLDGLPNSNETSIGVKISNTDLNDVEWIDVQVRANFVSPGNKPGTVGIDGDRIGFALAAKGVIRDSTNWGDSDGDGISNSVDICPNQNPQGYDLNEDGCSDDTDQDGIIDQYDICPITNSNGFDTNLDGCIDDLDGDGVLDDIDECSNSVFDELFPVDDVGCRPVDMSITISSVEVLGVDNGIWNGELRVSWRIIDLDGDAYISGARVMVNQTGMQAYFPILLCEKNGDLSRDVIHNCSWNSHDDLPIFDVSGLGMHVQIFAQSLNNSPDGDVEIKYFDSPLYFTTESSFNSDRLIEVDVASASTVRSMFWGVLTIIGVALLVRKIWFSLEENGGLVDKNRVLNFEPFIDGENE